VGCGPQVKPTNNDIHDALDGLEKSIYVLAEDVDSLVCRLDVVLRGSVPVASGHAEHPRDDNSNMNKAVRDATLRVYNEQNKIRCLLGLLDL
jgi:hypothetical protein